MRGALVLSVVGVLAAATGTAAHEPYLKGNDTGGIIAWSCEAEAMARQLAAAHCARFDKYPRITGVHRQYGDYISFQCFWNPRLNRFAIPAVRTRSACYAHGRHEPRVRVLY